MEYGKYMVHETGVIVFIGTEDEYGVDTLNEDPWSKYDAQDVLGYVRNNPDMAVSEEDYYRESRLREELLSLKTYLDDTDWCVVKCMELGLPLAGKYPEVAKLRAEARARINEIEGDL